MRLGFVHLSFLETYCYVEVVLGWICYAAGGVGDCLAPSPLSSSVPAAARMVRLAS